MKIIKLKSLSKNLKLFLNSYKLYIMIFMIIIILIIIVFVIYNKFFKKKELKKKKIIFAQSAPFTGLTKSLGIQYKNGVIAEFLYYNKTNKYNVEIQLISKDDQYEPEMTIANTKQFAKRKDILGLVAYVGTPTSEAIMDYIKDNSVLFIGAFTGAAFLRYPFQENIINIRLSYTHEVNLMVKFIVYKQAKYVSLFYQNDSFGKVVTDPLKIELKKNNIKIIHSDTYERNTLNFDKKLPAFKNDKVDFMILIGTSGPVAKFINKTKKDKIFKNDIKYFTASFVGPDSLQKGLDHYYKDIYVTSIVPNINDISDNIITKYQKVLKQYNPDLTKHFVSFEGYMVGNLVCSVIDLMMENNIKITKSNFISTIYNKGLFVSNNIRFGPYGRDCYPKNAGCPCNQGLLFLDIITLSNEGIWESLKFLNIITSCQNTNVEITESQMN